MAPVRERVRAAIFLYDMCVVTGHFETVKYTIVALSSDKRLLALLLAYCFSSFVEGEGTYTAFCHLPTSPTLAKLLERGAQARAASPHPSRWPRP